MMPPLLAVLAALAAASLVALWYGRREEAVPGRWGPAILRAAALGLLLLGLLLPPLSRRAGASRAALLVDASASMSLPAVPGGASRVDSARLLAGRLPDLRVFWFGEGARRAPGGIAVPDAPSDRTTRVAPAIEAIAGGGIDSIIVLTDGELDDPFEAGTTARRVGVGVREVRVAAPVARIGLRSVQAPSRAVAGDTIWLGGEIVTGGPAAELPPRIILTVADASGAHVAAETLAVPAPGRSARFGVPVVAQTSGGRAGWQPLDVRLAGGDPLGVADRVRTWVRVAERGAGAVLVAVDPDREASHLLPVLDRAAKGGAKAFLRTAEDRWIRVGREPRPGITTADVRREAEASGLLVVQGSPVSLPAWLRATARAHDRLLVLARGPGPVPGTPVRLAEPLDGEWYVDPSLPSSPLAGSLAAAAATDLPPLRGLFAIEGPFRFGPIHVRRNRRGAARPPLVAGRTTGRRWAVVAATGTWRWAARAGEARQAYRSLYAALAGWLLEAEGPPVRLDPAAPRSGEPVRWRVASGLRDLSLTVFDSTGAELWSLRSPAPDSTVSGPRLPRGTVRYRATATGPAGTITTERPFTVARRGGEWLPRRLAPPLRIAAGSRRRRPVADPGSRAIWPFALALLALGGEWLWRRRIGLR